MIPAGMMDTEIRTHQSVARSREYAALAGILLLAAAPAWPYSRGWGYYPSGTLGTVLLILIILVVLGYIPF